MARKVSEQAVNALLYEVPFKKSNTRVTVEPGVITLLLHGNAIMRKVPNGPIEVSTGGYNSVTTRERLNALPGLSVRQHKGDLYLNGYLWEDQDWTDARYGTRWEWIDPEAYPAVKVELEAVGSDPAAAEAVFRHGQRNNIEELERYGAAWLDYWHGEGTKFSGMQLAAAVAAGTIGGYLIARLRKK